MEEIAGIWDVLARHVKSDTGKELDSLQLQQTLAPFDRQDISEEELANIVADAISGGGSWFETDTIIQDMELMGFLLPTTIDTSAANQVYTLNLTETIDVATALLRERFGWPVKATEQMVGVADEGPDGKTTYDDEPKPGDWDDSVFREDFKRYVRFIAASLND